MRKQSTDRTDESSVTWANLEEWVLGQVQAFIERLLEDEVKECLGRQKSARRVRVDAPPG